MLLLHFTGILNLSFTLCKLEIPKTLRRKPTLTKIVYRLYILLDCNLFYRKFKKSQLVKTDEIFTSLAGQIDHNYTCEHTLRH